MQQLVRLIKRYPEAFSADQNMRPIAMADFDSLSKGSFKADTHNFLFRESKKE